MSMVTSDEDSIRVLKDVSAARRRARRARPAKWVPLAGLAVVVLGAMPFYLRWPAGLGHSDFSGVGGLSGYGLLEHPTAAAIYWLVALPLAYGLIVAYLARSGLTAGIRLRVGHVAGWGLALFAVAVLLTVVVVPQFELLPGDLLSRGLTPLFAISGGIMMWGWLDRDMPILGIGVFAMATSVVANLYDLQNLILAQNLGFDPRYGLLLNLALPALVLAVGAIAVAKRDRASR